MSKIKTDRMSPRPEGRLQTVDRSNGPCLEESQGTHECSTFLSTCVAGLFSPPPPGGAGNIVQARSENPYEAHGFSRLRMATARWTQSCSREASHVT
jgi:hypothetical protein